MLIKIPISIKVKRKRLEDPFQLFIFQKKQKRHSDENVLELDPSNTESVDESYLFLRRDKKIPTTDCLNSDFYLIKQKEKNSNEVSDSKEKSVFHSEKNLITLERQNSPDSDYSSKIINNLIDQFLGKLNNNDLVTNVLGDCSDDLLTKNEPDDYIYDVYDLVDADFEKKQISNSRIAYVDIENNDNFFVKNEYDSSENNDLTDDSNSESYYLNDYPSDDYLSFNEYDSD